MSAFHPLQKLTSCLSGSFVENFDYLVGLISIVVGLGLAEVAGGMDRLLRSWGVSTIH